MWSPVTKCCVATLTPVPAPPPQSYSSRAQRHAARRTQAPRVGWARTPTGHRHPPPLAPLPPTPPPQGHSHMTPAGSHSRQACLCARIDGTPLPLSRITQRAVTTSGSAQPEAALGGVVRPSLPPLLPLRAAIAQVQVQVPPPPLECQALAPVHSQGSSIRQARILERIGNPTGSRRDADSRKNAII